MAFRQAGEADAAVGQIDAASVARLAATTYTDHEPDSGKVRDCEWTRSCLVTS